MAVLVADQHYTFDREIDGLPIVTSIARLASGGFVLATVGPDPTGRSYGGPLTATVYDAQGLRVAATTVIASTSSTIINVVGLASGGFVVAWADGQSRVSGPGTVNTRIFEADGTARAGAAAYASATYGITALELSPLSNGDFILAAGLQGFAETRLVTLSGNNLPRGAVASARGDAVPELATLQDGDGLVVLGAAVRRYDPDTGTIGSADLMTITPAAGQKVFGLTATTLSSGNVLLSWAEGSDRNNFVIHGQIYNAAGVMQSGSFDIPLGYRSSSLIGRITTTALTDDGFALIYRAGGDESPLLAQVFAAGASPVGQAFAVDDGVQNGSSFVSVDRLDSGALAIAYSYIISGTYITDTAVRLFSPTIAGTDAAETLTGGSARDTLIGFGGADILVGAAGDDVLIGGAGADTLNGGTGNDTADYSTSISAVNVDLETGSASGGDAGGDSFVSIENLIGSAFDDVLTGSATSKFFPNDGHNRIDGGAGADRMTGGSGNDTFVVDNAGDTVVEFANGGFDTIVTSIALTAPANVEALSLASETNVVLTAGTTGTTLIGNMLANTLVGGSGADRLYGLYGSDMLTGGDGRDTFIGSVADLAGDTIADFRRGDRIVVTDGVIFSDYTVQPLFGSLTFGNGQYGSGSVAIPNADVGRIAVRAQAGGGVVVTHLPIGANDFTGEGYSDILWRNAKGTVTDWTSLGGYALADNPAFYRQVALGWQVAGTGDFNGDGRVDILWRNVDGTVTNWLSNGTTFVDNATLNRTVPLEWRVERTADFNADGLFDILWRHADGTVTNWFSNGTGFVDNAALHEVVGADWHIAGTGDFNGDGRGDVLWRNDDGTVTTWVSREGGLVRDSSHDMRVAAAWHIVATGDLNGDSTADILWRNNDGTVTYWAGSDNGWIGSQSIYRQVSLDWQIQTVGDYDGNGSDDILWQNANGTVTTWLLRNGGTTIQENAFSRVVPPEWSVVQPSPDVRTSALFAAADFNGDGKDDLLWRNSTGLATNWLSTGTGFADNSAFQRAVTIDWQIAGTGDFDGDGAADLLWRNADGTVTNWFAQGTGFRDNAALSRIVDVRWHIQATGDYDGDGRDDILWRHADGTVTDWFSTGMGFADNAAFNRQITNAWQIQASADFNGDGRDDILWRNADGTMTDWRSNGTGFSDNAAFNRIVSADWRIAGVGDFDGDGRADILWRNVDGTVTTWSSTGSGFADNAAATRFVSLDWQIMGIGDYNGDGRADIAWRNADGTIIDWLSTGASFVDNTASVRPVGLEWNLQTHTTFDLL